jgi:hypothetical protein
MSRPRDYVAVTIVEKDAGGRIIGCLWRNTMRKRQLQLGSVIVLWTLVTSPAFAGGFRVDIFCDPPPAAGEGKISSKGTGQFHVQELPPNATFTCAVDCVVLGGSVEQACTSDAQGRLDATLETGLVVCLGPVLVIKQEATLLCASGLVFSLPIVPHP